MPVIHERVYIAAPPEAVYALIADVTQYSSYSRAIRAITDIGGGRYRWRVELMGVALAWDAEVTETERPARFAWHSLSGVENHGRFELTPSGQGTEVELTLHYRLPLAPLNWLASGFERPLIALFRHEILGKIKHRLERTSL